jgi:mitogen-activated protein kinase kinase 3
MSRGPKMGIKIKMPDLEPPPDVNLDDKFIMKMEDGAEVEVQAKDLERIRELGRGAYGVVEEMRHSLTGVIFAVKVLSFLFISKIFSNSTFIFSVYILQ